MMRHIVEITAAAVYEVAEGPHVVLFARATDGTAWSYEYADITPKWKELPALPQGDSRYITANQLLHL